VANALVEAERGLIDLSGLWVAHRRGAVVGALLTQSLAGRAAAFWAPEVALPWRRGSTAVALVRAALDDLSQRGFLLAQALLDESTPKHGAADLTAGGMPHVTDLIYLETETTHTFAFSPEVPPIDWVPFSSQSEPLFRKVLQSTYINSLDMPELEGLRSLDDVLASHKACGRFVADRWRVGQVRGEPDASAVLLLSEVPDRDAWEVAYLGLSPQARGRGLGRAILATALAMARPHVAKIELAVDIRNHPALHLYTTVGLRAYDRRSVHLASFR
jgi:GNAT superfamily N-acetyltransferase